jgi:hypothetical protein
MVAATLSRDFALMAPPSVPMAQRRSAVMFAGPWPVRMVQRPSSQLQSRV